MFKDNRSGQLNSFLLLKNVCIVICSKELMYQQVLHRFAHFNAIQLSNPAPLSELIILALKEEDVNPVCNENDGFKEKVAEVIRCPLWYMFLRHKISAFFSFLIASCSLCLMFCRCFLDGLKTTQAEGWNAGGIFLHTYWQKWEFG